MFSVPTYINHIRKCKPLFNYVQVGWLKKMKETSLRWPIGIPRADNVFEQRALNRFLENFIT